MAAKNGRGANLDFKDKLRGNMDAAECEHVALGLILLGYTSDAFEEQHARLQADQAQRAAPEAPDKCGATNGSSVPAEARCQDLRGRGRGPRIGLGDSENRSENILSHAHEYFLSQFCRRQRQGGGQFCTPRLCRSMRDV